MAECKTCGNDCLCEKGPRGPRGYKGDTGDTGPQGPIGLTGPQGPPGSPGLTGIPGEKGLTGNKGTLGPPGPQGLPGLNGSNGVNGTNGEDGAPGDTGPKGDIGEQGLQGDIGPIGPMGLVGEQGPQGVPGPNYPAISAQNQPQDVLKSIPALNGTRLCDSAPRIISEVYDDDGSYDPTTGIWTCPATGRYNLNFYVHLTRASGNGFYDAAYLGMVGAGIVFPASCNFYCVDYVTITQIMKHVDITGSALGVTINTGVQLCLKIINLTNFDYISLVGDVQRLTIQRVL